MRSVPGPAQGEERSFDLPVEDGSIRAVVRTPTLGQRRRWYAASGVDGQALAEVALAECFVRVEGYTRQTLGGQVPIETLADLREYGETSIPESIAAEIVTGELLKKTLGGSSASTSPNPPTAGIEASPGTAASAGAPASAPSAAATDQPPGSPL